jgi:hypothetical protein
VTVNFLSGHSPSSHCPFEALHRAFGKLLSHQTRLKRVEGSLRSNRLLQPAHAMAPAVRTFVDYGILRSITNAFLTQAHADERLWLIVLNHIVPPITAKLWDRGAFKACILTSARLVTEARGGNLSLQRRHIVDLQSTLRAFLCAWSTKMTNEPHALQLTVESALTAGPTECMMI